jgi:phage portal protein BeeE
MGTAFRQYSAQDWTTMWEETIERDLLDPKNPTDANVYVMLDLRGLMRADSTGRANYYSRALGGGGNRAWMTVNEVRALEDLNPLPGGDELPEPSASPQPLLKPEPGGGQKD